MIGKFKNLVVDSPLSLEGATLSVDDIFSTANTWSAIQTHSADITLNSNVDINFNNGNSTIRYNSGDPSLRIQTVGVEMRFETDTAWLATVSGSGSADFSTDSGDFTFSSTSGDFFFVTSSSNSFDFSGGKTYFRENAEFTDSTDSTGRCIYISKADYDLSSGGALQYPFGALAVVTTCGSNQIWGCNFVLQVASSATQSAQTRGMFGGVWCASVGSFTADVYGAYSEVASIGAGSAPQFANVYGHKSTVQDQSGVAAIGVSGKAVCYYADGIIQGPLATGLRVLGTAVNFYGEAHSTGGGNLTNCYGLDLEEQTAGATLNIEAIIRGAGELFFRTATNTAANKMSVNSATDLHLDLWGPDNIDFNVGGTERANFSTTALNLSDGINVVVGSSTGTKIGTATTQKISFFNSTPIAQPSSTGETTGFTAGAGTTVTDQSTFTGNVGSTAYRISDVVKHLKNLGLIAA